MQARLHSSLLHCDPILYSISEMKKKQSTSIIHMVKTIDYLIYLIYLIYIIYLNLIGEIKNDRNPDLREH